MNRKRYPSDLTNQEWVLLQPLLPRAKSGGRPRKTDLREVINATTYLLRTGCAWRMLPHEFPPWQTVYEYFAAWRDAGIWEGIHTALREQLRVRQSRSATPSAGIVDSQSVRSTEKGGYSEAMTQPKKSRAVNVIC
jgi:putative transposase